MFVTVLVNCVTNPLVNIIFQLLVSVTPVSDLVLLYSLVVFYFVALEGLVVFVEYKLFKKFIPEQLHLNPLLLSILMNGSTILLSVI